VRCRCDLDRLLGDVEHLEFEKCLVDAWQPAHDRLAREMRHVEPDPAVRRTAAFLDLRVLGERDPVPGG
jgi:hypothetical protein